jgi:hypothetical protein
MSSPAGSIVIALVLVVVFGGWTDFRDKGTWTQASRSRPAQIVAVKTDGRVVLLSSRNGRELRTLATGADRKTTVAFVTSLGRVFFDRRSDRGCGPREIVSVPIAGGRVRRPTSVAGASAQPSVSPDGKKLAFVNYQGPAGCTESQSIAIKELNANGSVTGWTARDGRHASTKRAPSSCDWWASPTTLDYSPRSMTLNRGASSATSRRRSPT